MSGWVADGAQVFTAEGKRVAVIGEGIVCETSEEWEERTRHARLVAAAPDMQGRIAQLETAASAKIRYARVRGTTFQEMRENIPADLYRIGDTVLVWANEGDLCFSGEEFALVAACPYCNRNVEDPEPCSNPLCDRAS